MDPLRSFAELLSSMWRARRPEVARTNRGEAVGRAAEGPRSAGVAQSPETLRARIRNRIVNVGTADPRLARETFVEAVLGWELGDDLARDPAFAEMVRRLSEHIEGEPRLNARLQELLQDLAREP